MIESHADCGVTDAQVLAHLADRVVRWWLPDAVIFAEVPLTATGKIDKKVLRERYCNCLMDADSDSGNNDS